MPGRTLSDIARSLIATVDPVAFAAIRERHANDNAAKYLDLERYLPVALRRAQSLKLTDWSAGVRRVLDLGCGAGYFLYVCQRAGHEVLGVDMPTRGPMFTEITRLLNVPILVTSIMAFQPLELPARKFDVITAHMVTFNRHTLPTVWGVPEWTFFLDDLQDHLVPGGTICLELNREPDTNSCYTPALRKLFEGRGAKIDDHRIELVWRP